jgi:hypothetical protein
MTGKTNILVVEDQTSVATVLRRMQGADGLERRKSHAADPARSDMAIFITRFNWHLFGKIRLGRGIINSQKGSCRFPGKAKNGNVVGKDSNHQKPM